MKRWFAKFWRGTRLDKRLLALDDEAFIDAAYRECLHREPDSLGKQHYLRLLHQGVSRKRILRSLCNSREAKALADIIVAKSEPSHANNGISVNCGRSSSLYQDYWPPLSSENQPRLAILGTCAASDLARLKEEGRIQHYLYDSLPHSVVPQLSPGEFDAVVVVPSLRAVLAYASSDGNGDLFHVRPGWDFTKVRERAVECLRTVIDQVKSNIPTLPLFFHAFFEPPAQFHGVLGQNRRSSLYALVRDLNDAMEEMLHESRHGYFIEVNDLLRYHGDADIYDGYQTHFTHAGYVGMENVLPFARNLMARIDTAWRVLCGQNDPIKLIIVDLDNTLWQGVLAEEDEIIPWRHTEGWPLGFAEALLECKRRGILLAICSKNDDMPTRERFSQVWLGRLKLDDFCSIHINWQPKPENIGKILRETNILPANTLFIDDNPLEIEAVRQAWPQMRFLTGNPTRWRQALIYSAQIQVAHVSEESQSRTELIRAKLEREQMEASMSREAFLQSLGLLLRVERINDSSHPTFARAVELLNKTNQFNTTGQRWGSEELAKWLAGGGILLFFRAQDRLANHGVIALLLLSDGVVVQAVLSCRVFGLGIDTAMWHTVAKLLQPGPVRLMWRDSGRNASARLSLESHGWIRLDDRNFWQLDTAPDWPVWIKQTV
jgi:FkbH-like protein